MGAVYVKAERYGQAYHTFTRICQLAPKRFEAWNNLGMSLAGLSKYKQAREAFQKALALNPDRPDVIANVALTFLEDGERQKAIDWAEKALKRDPNHAGAKGTLGFAMLGQGKWDGWDHYKATLGGKFRKAMQYGEEPLWDGTEGKSLVVYGEQGLGDEIMYASCLPDLQKRNKVTLDCDKRLEGLFRRSFPEIEVHGTRRDQSVDWIQTYDANVPIGMLPSVYRRKTEDFPQKPYLKPDPWRVLQWKTLFKTFKNPVVGLCWTGGSKHNHPERRAIELQDLEPLLEKDAIFVSLQYKDSDSHPKILEFPRATRTPDYDDTAGLVAALDMVIGIHTTAHHLAGAMGVPQVILVPSKCSWLYSSDFPWYGSPLFRQRENEPWRSTIRRLCDSDLCRF